MKILYLFVTLSPLLLMAIGCSSTYKVIDYPSEEKFHEDINSSIENRNFDVVTDDSSFTCFEGSKITDDSLYAVTKILKEKETISSRDIKEIKYFSKAHEAPSTTIWLKNGEELRAEDVMNLSGSTLQFTNIKINSGYIPIDKVKEISYKAKWKGTLIGVPRGFVFGIIAGGILGATGTITHVNEGGNHLTFDQWTSMIEGAALGAVIGIVVGPIIGYIIGWNNIFQFEP